MRDAWCGAYRRWWTASRASPTQIARAISGTRYDLGVIEHSWCAPYLEQLSPVCARTVLDLHNVESVLHAALRRGGRPRHRHRPPRLPRRLAGTGARLAAALFAGARHLAGRCRTRPRHRTASHGRRLPERPAADAAAGRRRRRGHRLFRQHGVSSQPHRRALLPPGSLAAAARALAAPGVAPGGKEPRRGAALTPPATRESKSPAPSRTPCANSPVPAWR